MVGDNNQLRSAYVSLGAILSECSYDGVVYVIT